ncbi:MAG: cellulase family glycosylhydrolase [Deltaproteobacteria bacterium]|nr:cellulase family glycosylhydrolase [Deltaproteobacteria bacterium]
MKVKPDFRAAIVFSFLPLLVACEPRELLTADAGPADAGAAADSGTAADAAADVGRDASVAAERGFLTDGNGRVLILHGANVANSAKGSPYLPGIAREQVLRLSADWGFNFVRYLMLWAGVEPEPGVYDTGYLDEVEQRLDWFHEAGIWVLLDMHQDVYSEFTCGNGAPEWAVRTDGLSVSCPSQWFLGYFEPGVKRCFDNFWDADGGHADLQRRYAAMWAAVTERFKNHPAVIAYDIMNEPHPGSDFDALEALGGESPDSPSPGFDREKLQPFYQRVIDSIRQVDTEHWIAFESRYGAPGNGMPSYFTRLVDPRDGAPRLLYAPHLYSVNLENNQAYDPENDKTVANWEKHRSAEAERLGVALVAGEWGLGPDWKNARLFMREVLGMADRLMMGWSYWSWDPGGWSWMNPDETERETVNDVVRVYPRRIAGVPDSFGFDPDTKTFRMSFHDRAGVEGPTEIYIPEKRFYPAGFDIVMSDAEGNWSAKWDPEKETLELTTPFTGGVHVVGILPRT